MIGGGLRTLHYVTSYVAGGYRCWVLLWLFSSAVWTQGVVVSGKRLFHSRRSLYRIRYGVMRVPLFYFVVYSLLPFSLGVREFVARFPGGGPLGFVVWVRHTTVALW